MRTIDGVCEASANPITGSLLILYDRQRLAPAQLWEALCERDLVSGVQPILDEGGVTRITLPQTESIPDSDELFGAVARFAAEKLLEAFRDCIDRCPNLKPFFALSRPHSYFRRFVCKKRYHGTSQGDNGVERTERRDTHQPAQPRDRQDPDLKCSRAPDGDRQRPIWRRALGTEQPIGSGPARQRMQQLPADQARKDDCAGVL